MGVVLRKLGAKTVEVEGSKFTVRVVDAEEEAKIMDNLFKLKEDKTIKLSTGETSLEFVRETLEGWEGVQEDTGKVDEKGKRILKDIPFSPDLIALLPSATILKLAEAAQGEQLSEEDRKK